MLLPGIFVVIVTWVGARFVLSGTIDAGDLVAFYGYAAFLVIPLRTAGEAVDKITRALVGARRMVDVLSVQPLVTDPPESRPVPEEPRVPLRDIGSGLTIEPGLLTCLVSAVPTETAAIAGRLGRVTPGDGVVLGDQPLETLPLDAVRRLIVVSEQDPDPLLGRASPPARPVAACRLGRGDPRRARRRQRR